MNVNSTSNILAFAVLSLSCLFSGTTKSNQIVDYARDLTQRHPMVAAFAAGYAARSLAMQTGGLFMSQHAQTPKNQTYVEKTVGDYTGMMGTFAVAIPVWTLDRQIVFQHLNAVPNSTPLYTPVNTAWSSGMDAVLLKGTIEQSITLGQKLYTYTHEELKQQAPALLTTAAISAANLWASFKAGEKFALKVANPDQNNQLFTYALFAVGLTLAQLAKETYFAASDYVGLTPECKDCRELYGAGENWSYAVTGIIPGFWKLFTTWRTFRAPTAQAPHID